MTSLNVAALVCQAEMPVDGSRKEWCTAPTAVRESPVNDIVDMILNTYGLMRPIDAGRLADSREKISGYIEKLTSAGQTDAQKLAVYGLAYLKELHEGTDPRFSGC